MLNDINILTFFKNGAIIMKKNPIDRLIYAITKNLRIT